MNRAKPIQQIEQTRTVLEKLLALLQSAPPEPDRLVSSADKSGKHIERCVIATFRIAEAWASRVSFAGGGNTCCGLAIRQTVQTLMSASGNSLTSRRQEPTLFSSSVSSIRMDFTSRENNEDSIRHRYRLLLSARRRTFSNLSRVRN
jgi:hypothetical protein